MGLYIKLTWPLTITIYPYSQGIEKIKGQQIIFCLKFKYNKKDGFLNRK